MNHRNQSPNYRTQSTPAKENPQDQSYTSLEYVFVNQDEQGPPSVMDRDYIPGYLKTLIGKVVRAEFLIGASQTTDRVGRMVEVGVNYFVLEDINFNTRTMCDLYSVKFVTEQAANGSMPF